MMNCISIGVPGNMGNCVAWGLDQLIFLLLIFAIILPVLVVTLFIWLVRLVAAIDVPQDTIGRGADPRSLSWLGRLRNWLTATPKRLDYRRDKKGRFRRVRRG